MPTININSFAGIMPMVHPTLLPDGCAVKAHNCRLHSGKLSPVRQPAKATNKKIRLENGLSQIADAQSLHLWKRNGVSEFLAWPGIVNVAKGNIANDALTRLFVSGQTGIGGAGKNHPCAYIASASGLSFNRHSLVKTVLSAPVATRPVGGGVGDNIELDSNNIRYTYFIQTWVDEYGYESGGSLPSTEMEYNDGDIIEIDAISSPSGNARLRRIYKVVTGTETEYIQFIQEQAVTGSGFIKLVFAVKDEDAGETLPLIVSAPDDLTWMGYMPGSFYVGVSASNKRTVMFSDVDRPTSWPDAYRYDIRDDFVGHAITGNTVFILTTGYPWVISGTAPESMTTSIMAGAQACVSPRSICVMEGVAFYASQDGICMLSESNPLAVTVITKAYFSKREWEELNPSSCIMACYDGALHCWFTLSNNIRQGYIIDISKGVKAITTHDEQAKAVCYDVESDNLYYVREI